MGPSVWWAPRGKDVSELHGFGNCSLASLSSRCIVNFPVQYHTRPFFVFSVDFTFPFD